MNIIKDDMKNMKLIYRANLHRNFLLKHRAFFVWKNSVNISKKFHIKLQLAKKLYRKKTLQKYFYILCINCKYFNCQQIINAYLRSNIVTLYRIMYMQELLLWIIDIRKQMLIQYEQLMKAKIFFTQKYIKNVQPLFIKWKKYTNNNLLKKEKITRAIKFYNLKILKNTFYILYKHSIKKKNSKILFDKIQCINIAISKKYVFSIWKEITAKHKSKRRKFNFVKMHHLRKLKTFSFLTWKKYAKRKMYLMVVCNKLKLKQNKKLIQYYLYNWSLYTQQKRFKKEKMELSILYYNSKLLQKVFGDFLSFYKLQKIKDAVNNYTVEKYIQKKSESVPSVYLNKWKSFVEYNKKLKLKLQTTEIRHIFCIKKRYFSLWKDYIEEKKYKKNLLKAAQDYNKLKIKDQVFRIWLQFTKQEKKISKIIEEHKKEFEIFLLKYCLKQIINKGEEKQQSRNNNLIEIQKHNFYIKLFYFKKWKYQIWNNKNDDVVCKKNYKPYAEKTLTILNRRDVQILKPKIPSYFDKKNTLLL